MLPDTHRHSKLALPFPLQHYGWWPMVRTADIEMKKPRSLPSKSLHFPGAYRSAHLCIYTYGLMGQVNIGSSKPCSVGWVAVGDVFPEPRGNKTWAKLWKTKAQKLYIRQSGFESPLCPLYAVWPWQRNIISSGLWDPWSQKKDVVSNVSLVRWLWNLWVSVDKTVKLRVSLGTELDVRLGEFSLKSPCVGKWAGSYSSVCTCVHTCICIECRSIRGNIFLVKAGGGPAAWTAPHRGTPPPHHQPNVDLQSLVLLGVSGVPSPLPLWHFHVVRSRWYYFHFIDAFIKAEKWVSLDCGTGRAEMVLKAI